MENIYPGLWRRWFKSQCVAVGWCANWGFPLEGAHSGGNRWSRARNAIKAISEGDLIVVSMKDNRVSRVGEVINKRITDEEWDPLVPKSKSEEDGEMGRRINVRWRLDIGPEEYGFVVKLPEDCRFTIGELRPTVSEIKSINIDNLFDAMNNQYNWVKIYGHYANERSISDYIANYPYLLEDGLTQYPSAKVREKIFDDRTRLDVLLIDKNDIPVIVECKQQNPSIDNINQLLHYMEKLEQETDKVSRGIIVHGGSSKLTPEVKQTINSLNNIEIVSYRANIEFMRSN
jgi:hypothetical protein